ncbi:unnamed protein product, partial [Mesorhabditis spiculigera]
MRTVLVLGWVLVGVTAGQYDPDCKWRDNVTSVDEIAHHKYQVLEDCLYYKLSRDADKLQSKGNALMLLPPTVAAGETLDLEIMDVQLRQMWINEVFKEMNMNGYINLSWKDRRLRWDLGDYKTDNINIKSFGKIWVPDINSVNYQTASSTSDYTSYQGINAKYTGNITARLEFRMQAECQVDYSDFPNDVKHCCFNLRSSLYKYYIKYFLIGSEQLNVDNLRTNWHIADSWIKKTNQDGDIKAEQLEVCVTARRKSSTLSIELLVPVTVSALLLIIAPFFGKFKEQIHVKMFSLLIQFLSFQLLVNKTPQVGFGEHVPKIYVFYAFTLSMTIISLIITVIIAAIARVPRKLPPAHRYTLLANVLNANICCGMEETPVTDGTSTKDTAADWLQIHVAVNNLVALFVLLFYVIGAIVIIC